jgi:hypothetical protein
MYKLFLDDIRVPRNVYPTTSNDEWVIARSYDKFVEIITHRGLPFHVNYDHDLSTEHYLPEIDPSTYQEKTGYDAAVWLVEYCLKNKLELPSWSVHSANPIGRRSIEQYLGSWERLKEIYGKT